MPSLGVMKARIADELARSDLTTQIAYAITDAVKHHERMAFPWNEEVGTLTTVADQEFYSSSDAAWIGTAVSVLSLRYSSNNLTRPLTGMSMAQMDQRVVGVPSNSTPKYFALHGKRIRLWPVPGGAYTLTAAYIKRLPDFTSDTDDNGWTSDAEALIRTRAKIILWENVIRGGGGKAEGDRLRGVEAEILAQINRETAWRSPLPAIRAI